MRWLACILMTAALAVGSANEPPGRAGDAASLPLPPSPVSAEGARESTQQVRLPPTPPELPPRPPSPVTFFRQLLRATPEEREALLADRSPKSRAYLEEQLREFAALSPAEQEARLRLLELRFYLRPLLTTSPTNRDARLRQVPAAYREAVRDRLAEWDALNPDERARLLRDQEAAALLCLPPGLPPKPVSPEKQAELDRAMARWQRLDPAEQRRLVEQLGRFFQFSEEDKRRTLDRIAAATRPEMARLVAQLDQLPEPERSRCLQALARYVSLPEAERRRFLANAARWAAMTPEQREAWRRLHAKLPPMPPPMPPSPPGFRRQPHAATGGGD